MTLKPDAFRARLDDAEALPVGSGVLELRGVVTSYAAGVGFDASARVTAAVAAYAAGYVGVEVGTHDLAYGAQAGVRVRW